MRVRLRVDRLQQLLAESRLSQNHWALRLGISRGHWSEIVNGKHPYPSPKTRDRILEVFALPLEELFTIEAGPTTWSETDVRAALADRYLIDRELGQGAMGSVYLARDLARGRVVALKVISPEAVSEVGVTSFLREVSFVAQLHHPHILPLYDSGVVADHPYYVMPWVREGSLRTRLDAAIRLPLPLVQRIATGLASALEHAHEQRVLHCDVKPENVLLYGDHAYLMDFGIARALHRDPSDLRARRALDLSAGTPAYVSPEQASGEGSLDGRSDLYSLACVVYEMLTGRVPFEGTSTEMVVTKRFFAPPPPVQEYAPEVPAEVERTVARAMSVDRSGRQGTVTAFASELGAARVRSPLVAKLSLGWTRLVGPLRRRLGRGAPTRLGGLLGGVVGDLRQAARGLRRSPRFVAAFVLPLALALAAGTILYDLVDRALLRPPPGVVAPERLAVFAIDQTRPPFGRFLSTSLAWIDHEVLSAERQALAGVASFLSYRPSLGRGEGAREVTAHLVTANYFGLLGVTPAVGRWFTDLEDAVGVTDLPCVAGYDFYRTEMGADRESLGRRFVVGELTCTIVGVAPPEFHGIDAFSIDLFIPLKGGAVGRMGYDDQLWSTDRSHWIRTIGRLADGVGFELASEAATRAYRSFETRRRDPELSGTMVAMPLEQARGNSLGGQVEVASWLGGGAGFLVLLVVANLVNLLIARSLRRQRETAVRVAIGGGRGVVFRHLLVEAGLLALLAGVMALALAAITGPIAHEALFPRLPWVGGSMRWQVAAAAVLLAVLVAAVIAAITTLRAGRLAPAELLRSAAAPHATVGRRGSRGRMTLVAVQAGLSAALIVASVGFVRSYRRASSMDLGFDVDRVLVASLPLSSIGYSVERSLDFYERLHRAAAGLPGVESASLGYMTPWLNNAADRTSIPGRDSLPLAPVIGLPAFDMVTPDYLETMGLRLLAGRWIDESDREGGVPVIVVNQALARLYWPDLPSPVGRCLRLGADSMPCREIIGVVASHEFVGRLGEGAAAAYFVPIAQSRGFRRTPRLFVRTSVSPDLMLPTVQRLAQTLEPGLPAAQVRTLVHQLEPLLAPWRLGALAFTAIGGLAVLIALAGLYGVLGYVVAERQRELAIRAAVGATPGQVAAPVLRQGVVWVLAGIVGGVTGLVLLSGWLQALLFQVRLFDPAVVAGTVVVLLGLAGLAALGPARVASRQDPLAVLRVQ